MTERNQLLQRWLNGLGYRDYNLTTVSEDASFRSYLRMKNGDQSWIVMDAPPQQEPCDQFIAVAAMLRAAGLSAPEVISRNLKQGFLILSDFGSSDYLSVLNAKTEASLYGDSLSALLQMQTAIDATDLPAYDEALLDREMDLFSTWFLQSLLDVDISERQMRRWYSIKKVLIDNALEQPRVFVHRDYHSRNLMNLENANPGILDFQDAVFGPITYDLVSLLRDCYIDWPPDRVEQLVGDYHRLAYDKKLTSATSAQFLSWFNLMGVQRHLKAVGIFSRLDIRDGKSGYLKDIPRTLGYIDLACALEPSLAGFHSLMSEWHLDTRMKSRL